MSRAAVEFKDVSKDYGSGYVLKNFNLAIPHGKIVTMIGPSGCGKTTILKMINRLIEPDEGTIEIDGKDIADLDPVLLRRQIGYVIQQIGLFPHMTIEENISIVARLKGEKKKHLTRRTEELLELIGLDPETFRKRYPHELSGGQQQRVGVARALFSDPSIILMDEPFSALDPISRVQLQNELKKLNQQLKKTIIFVTHDIDEGLKIADQMILLNKGKIVQYATPTEILKNPANDFARQFIGEERFQPIHATKVDHIMVSSRYLLDNLPLEEAAKILQKEQKTEMIVTSKDLTLLGVIRVDDINRHISTNPKLTVGELMTTDIPNVSASAPVFEVLSLIKNYSIVPVTDDQHRFLGVVTRSDVIDSYQKHLAQERVII